MSIDDIKRTACFSDVPHRHSASSYPTLTRVGCTK